MRFRRWLVASLLLGTVAVLGRMAHSTPDQAVAQSHGRKDDATVPGKTQPAPGRSATLAPQVLQPVVKVLVTAGQVVKKDQVLIQLDDEDARLQVKAKEAKLTEAKAALAQIEDKPHDAKVDAARA